MSVEMENIAVVEDEADNLGDNDFIIMENTDQFVQDEAQLQMDVDDDGLAGGEEEETTEDGMAPVADEDDSQAYMYVSGGVAMQALQAEAFATPQASNSVHDRLEHDTVEVPLTAVHQSCGLQVSAAVTAAEIGQDGSSTSAPPLGSSQNPIRIVQHGNKFTSMQPLSSEQLTQIIQVS